MEMGPMGGQLADAGSFFFEVMDDPTDESFHIALLDIKKENPTVKDSKIKMTVEHGKKSTAFTCSVMDGTHYHCKPKQKYGKKNKGTLVLSGERDGVKAKHAATLALPMGMMDMMDMHHHH